MFKIQATIDCQYHANLILLDFRKAFDTVSHQRLLKKLHHYGIRGNIYDRLKVWLTQRMQRVVINGYESNLVAVKSGVPHAGNCVGATDVLDIIIILY